MNGSFLCCTPRCSLCWGESPYSDTFLFSQPYAEARAAEARIVEKKQRPHLWGGLHTICSGEAVEAEAPSSACPKHHDAAMVS